MSRATVKDSTRHVILGMQQFKPGEFAQQIALNMDNCWGILRCVIDICMKLDEGKYLIMKDPNKVGHGDHVTAAVGDVSHTVGYVTPSSPLVCWMYSGL